MMRAKRTSGRPGFSLIELIIVVVIIGIIAAIAIPKMSRGARNAGGNTLRMDLSIMRNAIELYATEHEGKFPDATLMDQLTMYSNLLGDSTTAVKTPPSLVYGPYLKDIPALPVGSKRGDATVAFDSTAGSRPSGAGTQGWWYNTADHVLRANLASTEVDDDGTAYNTY